MSDHPDSPEPRVAEACERTWDSLDTTADQRRGYCDDCALNVLDFAQMTRSEIDEAVTSPTERVCARILYRPDGSMVTADPAPAAPATPPRFPVVRRFVAVAATLLASTAALGLGGCDATNSDVPTDPPPSDTFETVGIVCPTDVEPESGPELMGEVEILGDVRVPEEPENLEPESTEPDSSSAEDLGPNGGWEIEVQPPKEPASDHPVEIVGRISHVPPKTPKPADDGKSAR